MGEEAAPVLRAAAPAEAARANQAGTAEAARFSPLLCWP